MRPTDGPKANRIEERAIFVSKKVFTRFASRASFAHLPMKAPWIVLSAVLAAAGLCAAAMWQSESTRATALEHTVAQLRADNAKLAADAAAAKENADSLESESAQLRAAHVLAETRLEASPAPMPQAEATPKDKGGIFAGMAGMLKDPAMRKMIAAQQAMALRGFYADFVKQAHLTPDEADKFFQLLGDRQSALMDSSANMMSGGKLDMDAVTAATNTANAALKDLLGPDRFSAYQEYEKTLGDRIQVQQFGQQLGSTGAPLQDYQSQALIQIMSQEQANMPNLQSPERRRDANRRSI